MSQNIYDNENFFKKYRELRKNECNYNNLVEQPAMVKLLPPLNEKNVLDLGCGYGCNCNGFIAMGATKVIGIDISEKMLNIAKEENNNEKIKYLKMDMKEISFLNEKFDFIYSSLAFHYVEDFNKLISDISDLLNDDGILLFSQEHPFVTAPKGGCKWIKDDNGKKLYGNLCDYMNSGLREVNWFGEELEKYHRPLSEIINSLISYGFVIQEIVEPVPSEEVLNKRPDYYDEFHRPTSIIIKAKMKVN